MSSGLLVEVRLLEAQALGEGADMRAEHRDEYRRLHAKALDAEAGSAGSALTPAERQRLAAMTLGVPIRHVARWRAEIATARERLSDEKVTRILATTSTMLPLFSSIAFLYMST